MRDDIRVSFKNTPEEDQLYDDIIEASKYIGKAIWMKLAAREKLERDRDTTKQKINNHNHSGGLIDSLDNLFQ